MFLSFCLLFIDYIKHTYDCIHTMWMRFQYKIKAGTLLWSQPQQPSQKELCPLSATYFLVTNVGMGRKAQECLKFQRSTCQFWKWSN